MRDHSPLLALIVVALCGLLMVAAMYRGLTDPDSIPKGISSSSR